MRAMKRRRKAFLSKNIFQVTHHFYRLQKKLLETDACNQLLQDSLIKAQKYPMPRLT